MDNQYYSPAGLGYLLKLNRFNNQAFFMRGFGHTFNNSFNSIQLGTTLLGHYIQDLHGLAEELADGETVAPFRKGCSAVLTGMTQVVNGISDAASNLDQFVSQLAEFTGAPAKAGNSAVDLNTVVTSCSAMIQHQIVQYTHGFRLELSETPVLLSPDCAGQMMQVVLNLVMNALLSLPDKGCTVVVSTAYDYEADRILLRICDDGTGIAEADLPRVCEPFFTTWKEHGCTGIGLTVASHLVNAHGGELSISSEVNRGTTVLVSLPYGKPDALENRHAG
jgi:polar amino acid transport system substrate-binding protein